MKYFRVQSAVIFGIRALPVEVECVQSRRLPHLQILGCSSSEAMGLRERIIAAFGSSGIALPARRITVRLSPPLNGVWAAIEALDLAVALSILGSTGAFTQARVEGLIVYGALRLDGSILSESETLPLRRLFRERGVPGALLPWGASSVLEEEGVAKGGGFRNLGEILEFLRSGTEAGPRSAPTPPPQDVAPLDSVLETVVGQAVGKRVLEISAAGAHHTLLLGARGAGKTLLARSLPGLLPPLATEAREELALIHRFGNERWDGHPPFRAPDPQLSPRRLVGSGPRLLGEFSLAHGGVLFLDELLERDRQFLEALRIPMERGTVPLGPTELPADAIVIGASNLCPCGGKGDPRSGCICSLTETRRYARRLSLALADRFDLRHVLGHASRDEKNSLAYNDLRRRIAVARAKMQARQRKPNGRLLLTECFRFKLWDKRAERRWRLELDRSGASQRSAGALARVALTISDLGEEAVVREKHVFEAAHYREAGA